jgi:hypothetical protein
MAVHRGPASLRPRCIWGGSQGTNLPSRGSGIQLHSLLSITLDNNEAINLTSWPLYPEGKKPQHPLNRKGVDPRAGLDVFRPEKNALPLPAIKPIALSPYWIGYTSSSDK